MIPRTATYFSTSNPSPRSPHLRTDLNLLSLAKSPHCTKALSATMSPSLSTQPRTPISRQHVGTPRFTTSSHPCLLATPHVSDPRVCLSQVDKSNAYHLRVHCCESLSYYCWTKRRRPWIPSLRSLYRKPLNERQGRADARSSQLLIDLLRFRKRM
jgi:hypothetical protein